MALNSIQKLLWATDSIEIRNHGAGHAIEFCLHNPKPKAINRFSMQGYDFDRLIEAAEQFIRDNSKPGDVHPGLKRELWW